MITLEQSRQILVTDTVSRLRLIRDLIRRAEDPEGANRPRVVQIKLSHVLADEVLSVARPLLGLGEEALTNENINISVGPFGTYMYAVGREPQINILNDLVKLVEHRTRGVRR